MRSTINIKFNSAEDYARTLRSLAAKIDSGDMVPGADFTRGNARVQVHTPQESDIRAFARANGFPVGSRGRYSKALTEAFKAHQEVEQAKSAAKAAKAEARKAARAAKAVNA